VQEYGEISNTKVMRDANSKASRGFGFVLYADGEAAQKAVTEMSDKMLCGKKLYVAIAQPALHSCRTWSKGVWPIP
jgi:RNA recognition motif-containing protein